MAVTQQTSNLSRNSPHAWKGSLKTIVFFEAIKFLMFHFALGCCEANEDKVFVCLIWNFEKLLLPNVITTYIQVELYMVMIY